MATYLFWDYETRSGADLKSVNVYDYAEDPTTSEMCLAYAFDDGPVKIWDESTGKPFPKSVSDHIGSGGKVVAHNLPFEYLIYNNVSAKRFNLPKFDLKNGTCTMACAFAAALPGSLENCAKVLGLEIEKDMAGNRIMLKFAKPRKVNEAGSIVFWTKEDKPEDWQRMLDYCVKDVVISREIFKRVPKLSKKEKEIWLLDQKINQRGVPIDLKSAAVAKELVEFETKRLNKKIDGLTEGGVSSCRANAQLVEWLAWEGIYTKSVDRNHVAEILESDASEKVKEVLRVKQKGSKSSNAKLVRMLNRGVKGRTRGEFQYHVATTGRWASWGIQLHNLPRRKPHISQKEVDVFFGFLSNTKSN